MKKFIAIVVFSISFGAVYSQNITWNFLDSTAGKNITEIIQDNTGRLAMLSEKGLFFTTDFVNYKQIDNLLPNSLIINCITFNSKNVLFAGTNKGLYYFNDTAMKWIDVSYNLDSVNVLSLAMSTKDTIAISSLYGFVYIKSSKDTIWNQYNSMNINDVILQFDPKGTLFSFEVDFLSLFYFNFDSLKWYWSIFDVREGCKIKSLFFDSSNIYVCTNSQYVYKLNNQKIKSQYFDGLKSSDFNQMMKTDSGDIILISPSTGLYLSNNNGISFEEENTGIENKTILKGIILQNQQILLSVQNSGIYVGNKPLNNPVEIIGWTDKGKYLERNAQPLIEKMKFSHDGNNILTVSNGMFKTFDIDSGHLIKTLIFSPYNSSSNPLGYLGISNDDSTLIKITWYKYWNPQMIYCVCYNLKSDSVLVSDTLRKFQFSYADKFSQIKACADFDIFSNTLTFGVSQQFEAQGAGSYSSTQGGVFKYKYIDTNIVRDTLLVYPVENFAKSNRYNSSIFLGNEYTDTFMDDWERNRLFLCDSNYEKYSILDEQYIDYHKSTGYYHPTILFRYFNQENKLLSLNDSLKISFWDLDTKKIISQNILKNYVINLEVGKSDKFIVTLQRDGLFIYSIPNLIPLDSMVFDNTDEDFSNISISNDSIHFAISSTSGFIRLFDFKDFNLTLPPDKVNENNFGFSMSISPNPFQDNFNLFYSLPKSGLLRISISDILGQEITVPIYGYKERGEYLQVLYLPELSSGIYFLEMDFCGKTFSRKILKVD